MARPGRVRLEIYDLAGRRVRTLGDRPFEPGRHELLWRGESDEGLDLAPGIYTLRLAAPGHIEARKIARVR